MFSATQLAAAFCELLYGSVGNATGAAVEPHTRAVAALDRVALQPGAVAELWELTAAAQPEWHPAAGGALLCLLVVYAKHAFYDLKVYNKVVVWVVLFTLLVVAIWTTAVVRRVLQMPRAVSVYSTWAQPNPTEWHGGR